MLRAGFYLYDVQQNRDKIPDGNNKESNMNPTTSQTNRPNSEKTEKGPTTDSSLDINHSTFKIIGPIHGKLWKP